MAVSWLTTQLHFLTTIKLHVEMRGKAQRVACPAQTRLGLLYQSSPNFLRRTVEE